MVILKKIAAVSLIEAIVAMVIIMLVYSASVMIFVNTSEAGNASVKLKAWSALEEYINRTVNEKNYIDEKTKAGNLILTRKTAAYENIEGLLTIEFKACRSDGRTLVTRKIIIEN
ncbi:MAG: hypothetical protein HY738_07460 [Bacteroidia bacterium]|nr:hypothetical protein [Bacteroidia bacterium]